MKIFFSLVLINICFLFSVRAQIKFQKVYNPSGNNVATSVQQTSDGGYIMGGSQLVKTDDWGVLQWTRNYPSVYANTTSDSGYVLVNNISDDILITKTDKLGDTLWTNRYREGIWARQAYSIEQINDGGYIVAGRFQDFSGSGMMLLKLNGTGSKVWKQTWFESTSAAFCYGLDVHQTSDGGFIMAGFTYVDYYDSNRHQDVYIVKTDSAGTAEWIKNIGTAGDEICRSVQQTAAGNYILTGTQVALNDTVSNSYVLKLDAFGDTLWTKTFGGSFYSDATSVVQTDDGGFVFTGKSNIQTAGGTFDLYVRKLDNNGNELWVQTFGGAANERGNSIKQTADKGIIVAGFSESFGLVGASEMYLIKMDSLGNADAPLAIPNDANVKSRIKVYPNPTEGNVYFQSFDDALREVFIYNLAGAKMLSTEMKKGTLILNIENYPQGFYIYEVKEGANIIQQGKVIVQ